MERTPSPKPSPRGRGNNRKALVVMTGAFHSSLNCDSFDFGITKIGESYQSGNHMNHSSDICAGNRNRTIAKSTLAL